MPRASGASREGRKKCVGNLLPMSPGSKKAGPAQQGGFKRKHHEAARQNEGKGERRGQAELEGRNWPRGLRRGKVRVPSGGFSCSGNRPSGEKTLERGEVV